MHTIARFLSRVRALPLLALLGAVALAPAQTKTALSGGPLALLDPTADFELSPLPPAGFVYSPAFLPWTMSASAGIAGNNSGFTGTQTAPSGNCVAFLQDGCTVSGSFAFPRGNSRLRFRGAQRANNGPNHQVVRITVAGTEVFEAELQDTTYRTYLTRPFYFGSATTANVTIAGTNTTGGNTGFVDLVELEPLSDWNDGTKWSPAGAPTSVNDVVIPSQIEMVMRGNVSAATVTVNGELLAAPLNATLTTRWVGVSGIRARFEVGQESTPYLQSFTLTLLDTQPSENAMGAGTAFLMAMDGGTIDVHGVDKTSWTKLTDVTTTASDPPQATEFTVESASGWAVGDEVVLAYTGHVSFGAGWGNDCPGNPYQGPRSQKRTITAINGNVITVGSPFDPQDHCAAPAAGYTGPNHPLGWVLDQRAEVANLTRNVRIRGGTTGTVGGHVMIMACCTAMPVGLGRFANVELSNMGQKRVLGRYPMHWHMLRDVRTGNYLRNSSIHACHNRGITVHGSHEVLVERNVVYDTEGHAVFLEDGVEENNLFLNNLVLATRKPAECEQMLPHDNSFDEAQNHSPASFWISNPNNVFLGNVAADSLGTAYWFALHFYPTGKSAEAAWDQEFTASFSGLSETLGTFADNVAHSLKMGVDVHDAIADGSGPKKPRPSCDRVPLEYCPGFVYTGIPTPTDPLDDDAFPNPQWQPTSLATLERLTAYGCTTGIYSGGGIFFTEQVQFDDCVFADNGAHVQFASANVVKNSLFVYDSGNAIYPRGLGINGLDDSYIAGFENGCAYVAYDGPGRVYDSHFVGYDGSTEATLVFSTFGAARRHTNYLFDGLTFAGPTLPLGIPKVEFTPFATQPLNHPFAHAFVWGIAIRDLDGSLSGGIPANPSSPYPAGTPHTLVSDHPMMRLVNGGATADVQTVKMTNAYLSPVPWGHLQVRYFSASGSPDPNTGLYTYAELPFGTLPKTTFVRQAYLGYSGVTYAEDLVPSGSFRQTPVIVRTGGTAVAQCDYEVRAYAVASPPTGPARVDVSLDDAVPGDAIRLFVTHPGLPNWTPLLAVRVHIDDSVVHTSGDVISTLPALPQSGPGTSTTWQKVGFGGGQAVELRLVVPAGRRTHRVSITW